MVWIESRISVLTSEHQFDYVLMLRTTLSLDDDVAVLLEKVRKAQGLSLKQAVNQALRTGLRQLTTPGPRARKFRTGTADLGRCLIGSLDDVSESLATAEGEAFQ
jgi:hypothetical protein